MAQRLVIVPLYRNAALLEGLVGSMLDAADDFAALGAKALFVNDSPGDKPLEEALKRELPRLDGRIEHELLVNPRNLGFIGACNRGMEMALADGQDVVLLNSDTLLTPGALAEMAAVAALDPMTGFVSPRSNNATICNSPYPDRFRALDFPEALAAHRLIEPFLPRQTYVPTVVGFCMLIRHRMLAEFGLFDPVYGGGYNEETDLVLRGNRRGYRAVMANRAFVYHMGAQSFSISATPPYERERKNRKVLLRRYPEYERAVERYFESAQFHAQNVLGGLVPDADGRRRVLFHAPYLHDTYNGTFEMTVRTIRAFVEMFADRFSCHIACRREALEFHGLDQVEGLTWLESEKAAAPYFAALRLSQPFSEPDLLDLPQLAAVTGYVMHDTIALDCLNLDEENLTAVWDRMLQTAGLLAYVSQFSLEQFNRRFDVPAGVVQVPALLSTDAAEYAPAETPAGDANAILIIGNHYAHKHAVAMADAIHSKAPGARVILLGVEVPERPNLSSYRSGELDPGLIERLYADAKVVVFPTHYEGFGLPVMQTLARQKPLLARRLPPFVEIAARTPLAANMHLYETTAEMAAAAIDPPAWTAAAAKTAEPVRRWAEVAADLAAGIERAAAGLDAATLRRRMAAMGADPDAPVRAAPAARAPGRVPDEALAELSMLAVMSRRVRRGVDRFGWRLMRVKAEQLIGLADRARDAGDFEIAADAYGAALKRRPKLDHIWVQYGHALKETGDRRGAEAAYRRALEIRPDVADTHLQLGHLLKIQNRLLEAKDSFARALELDPDLADAAREIAKLGELGAGHMRKAILLARDLVKGAPAGAVIGCVIARGGKVIGQGASDGRDPHAIDQALAEAGRKAKGASAFLTRDPKPAAAERLARAGVERVAIACRGAYDTAPLLKEAGVTVDRGFLETEARAALHYPELETQDA